ncbi:alpha/beta hydrolase-fold protein [Pontibacter korlensis]|uniref:Phospholipase n=1 Tax=Pontibacter korlensis TaxID=400092 RepID=A0A0E3ZGI8_9BACT|nr:alpha/beta hydrolase-fold protein [Pontibacter korlensis]AKD04003.1 phospholipase [Pontibacter korlensis]
MVTERSKYKTGRLTARTANGSGADVFTTGVQPLGLGNRKDGLLYVPQGYDNSKPAALAVMLHGAGAPAEQGLSLLQQYADEHNIILVAPASRKYSWDIIASEGFGPDVIFIDQALSHVFENYSIDPAHLAIGGFSDGGSYALCVGLTNGDLFTHIIAFSSGFVFTMEKNGKPEVFISHGIDDPVLPIDPCGRRIVPQLKQQGLEVSYTEFDGGHEIPNYISGSSVNWFLQQEK